MKALVFAFILVLSLFSYVKGQGVTLDKESFKQLIKNSEIDAITKIETKRRSQFKLLIEKIQVASIDLSEPNVTSLDNVFKVTIDNIQGNVEAEYRAEKTIKFLGSTKRVWKSEHHFEGKFSNAKIELVGVLTDSKVTMVSCHSSVPNIAVTIPRGKSLLEKAKKLLYKPLHKLLELPLKQELNSKLCPALKKAVGIETFAVNQKPSDDIIQ